MTGLGSGDGWRVGGAAATPGLSAWVDLDEELRLAFADCPDFPRMGKRMAQLRREAAHRALLHTRADLIPEAGRMERSFIAQGPIHLSLSRHDRPVIVGSEVAMIGRWHLSISRLVGRDRQPAENAELIGWIIAGFPEATRITIYMLNTGTAIHADIPFDPA